MKSKTSCKISILCFVYLFFSQIPFTHLIAQNLILNPGCEDSLVDGEIPNWSEVIGVNWTQRLANPEPYSGDAYFFPGAASSAELMQDVNVSDYAISIDESMQIFIFEGYVRSYPQNPTDYSRIVIEYLDTTKLIKLDSVDFGNYSTTSSWVQLTDTSFAPSGTRFIRIRLISTRRNGSNNDGYYDALFLSTLTTYMKHPLESMSSAGLTVTYPNPFSTSTTIEYTLTIPQTVTITFYNQFGKQVAVIEERQQKGLNKVIWTPENLADGIYYFRLEAGKQVASGKVVLVR